MRKACAYLRVSSRGQVFGDGLERQRVAVTAYCEANQVELVETYAEEGISGKLDDHDRPAMARMFSELDGTDIKTIVIEKMDRLARDLIIQEGILGRLRKAGYELISTAEPDLCSDDPTRKFIRRVLGAVAELDRDLIVNRLKAARRRIRDTGDRCEGRKRFGSGPEAIVVATMRSLRDQSHTPTEIARIFNRDGIPTRSGKKWHSATISRILRRPNA